MSTPITLAKYFDGTSQKSITVDDYDTMVKAKDRPQIADFLYHRFFSRYVKPFTCPTNDYKSRYKNGFAMMATACLMIEALESFYQGWETTQDRGEKVFNSFFARFPRMSPFKNVGFYKNVRCALLHQAETAGGFKIERSGPLFDEPSKTINAKRFHDALEECLKDYSNLLRTSDWDSEPWDNCRRKMRSIVNNCN